MAKKNDDDTIYWILGGVGAALGLYLFLRPKEEEGPGRTEAAPLPPLETPSTLPTVGAVATAFDNLKTNWRMGRIEAQAAWDTTNDLLTAVQLLQDAGVGDQASADELVRQIGLLREDIYDFTQLTSPAAA